MGHLTRHHGASVPIYGRSYSRTEIGPALTCCQYISVYSYRLRIRYRTGARAKRQSVPATNGAQVSFQRLSVHGCSSQPHCTPASCDTASSTLGTRLAPLGRHLFLHFHLPPRLLLIHLDLKCERFSRNSLPLQASFRCRTSPLKRGVFSCLPFSYDIRPFVFKGRGSKDGNCSRFSLVIDNSYPKKTLVNQSMIH